jgi:outer membrane protein
MYMQKRILFGVAVNFLGLIFLSAYVVRNRSHVVYVDSNKLINGYQGMIDARKTYQQKAGDWKANIDTLTNEVTKQIMDYEKKSARLTAKERQFSQELIQTKQKQLYDYQQVMNTQTRQDDNMTGEVITQINAYIKKYGEDNGYTIILAATDYGNVAYADQNLDITDKVLEGLNKQYKGQ